MQANAGSTADYDNSPQRTRGERIKIRRLNRFRRFRFEVRESQSDSRPISTDVIPFALPRDPSPNQNLCNLRNLWMIICSFVSLGRRSLPCLSYRPESNGVKSALCLCGVFDLVRQPRDDPLHRFVRCSFSIVIFGYLILTSQHAHPVYALYYIADIIT